MVSLGPYDDEIFDKIFAFGTIPIQAQRLFLIFVFDSGEDWETILVCMNGAMKMRK